MKFFIYKTLIVVFLVYVLFEFTIGQRINKFKEQINILNSSEGRNKIISKLKEEIKDANEKENYFDPEERDLISTFIKKITNELRLNEN